MPEAVLVLKSSRLGEPSVKKGLDFDAKNLKDGQPAVASLSLADVLKLLRFHKKVSSLALRYACAAIARLPVTAREKLDHTEKCRIERALYRFQLYCNLVGPLIPVAGTEQREIFFNHFATFELEQLASIYEFLIGVATRRKLSQHLKIEPITFA